MSKRKPGVDMSTNESVVLKKLECLKKLQNANLSTQVMNQLGSEVVNGRGSDQNKADLNALCEELVSDIKFIIEVISK
jgi:hypothetical protein